jgi:hypothetical protein
MALALAQDPDGVTERDLSSRIGSRCFCRYLKVGAQRNRHRARRSVEQDKKICEDSLLYGNGCVFSKNRNRAAGRAGLVSCGQICNMRPPVDKVVITCAITGNQIA